MSMQDPIADMCTRIRNAYAVRDNNLKIPASNFKYSILNILKEEGYIEDVTVDAADGKQVLHVKLKYFQGIPVIDKIQRVSRNSLRVYRSNDELPTVNSGMGIAIISTHKGVMTEKAARKQKIGGEVICTVE